jgi:uncharacterized protein
MSLEERYVRVPTCFTGEVDKFGYAFVPGSEAGIVLMDKRSKALLEDPSIYQSDSDDERIRLLLDNALIREVGLTEVRPRLCKQHMRSISTWLHIINNCNLDCPYCYIYKDGSSMTFDIAKVFMDKLEETFIRHSLKSVAIRISGGEPTLKRGLVEYIVRELYSRFQGKADQILPVIITNGVLMDESWIDFINKHQIRICFSLDGLGGWHDQTRFFKNGTGSFQIVFKNLESLLLGGVKPNILITITEKNIDGVEELNRYLVDKDLAFRYGVYRDTTGKYEGYRGFIEKLIMVLNNCYDYYARAIAEGRARFRHQLADIRIDRNKHLRCCGIGHSVVTVSHQGEVYLCQARMNQKPIGDIRENRTLLEMTHSQNTLPQLANYDVLDYNACRSCQWALSCGGGCPVVTADTYGTPLTASPYCELFKTMIPRLVHLKAISLTKFL